MMYLPVYVGIVTFNSLSDLQRCFEGLQSQTYPNLHIFALDNASTDGSVAWLKEHAPNISLIENDTNRGYGNGHNQIIKQANITEGYYMPLNPDVYLKPDYIKNLVEALEDKDYGWGTGKLLLQDTETGECESVLYSAGHAIHHDGYALNIGHGMEDSDVFDEAREVFGAPGAASVISVDLIRDISYEGNLFDADMFMYNEDVDLDWRARRAGWACWYESSAVACHRGSAASGYLRTQALGNRYLSVLKNTYPIDLIVYNLPLLFGHTALKLVISPRDGLYFIRYILKYAPNMLRKRQKPAVPRRTMVRWFRWSWKQPSNQPRTCIERFKQFLDTYDGRPTKR